MQHLSLFSIMSVPLKTSALPHKKFHFCTNNLLLNIAISYLESKKFVSLVQEVREVVIVTSKFSQSNHVTNYQCDFGQPIVNGLLILVRAEIENVRKLLKIVQKMNKSNGRVQS